MPRPCAGGPPHMCPRLLCLDARNASASAKKKLGMCILLYRIDFASSSAIATLQSSILLTIVFAFALLLTPLNQRHIKTAITCHHPSSRPRTERNAQQIVPTASNGVDAVNFRQMRESNSLHLEKQQPHVPPSPGPPHAQLRGVAGAGIGAPGTPGLGGDDGMDTAPLCQEVDLFGAFSSITLHYDGES